MPLINKFTYNLIFEGLSNVPVAVVWDILKNKW